MLQRCFPYSLPCQQCQCDDLSTEFEKCSAPKCPPFVLTLPLQHHTQAKQRPQPIFFTRYHVSLSAHITEPQELRLGSRVEAKYIGIQIYCNRE